MASVLEEIKGLYAEKQKQFEEFKRVNDERIAKLENNEAIGEVKQKLDRIEKDMDDTAAKIEKQFAELKRFGTSQASESADAEIKSAFDKLLRSGSSTRMSEAEIEAFQRSRLKCQRAVLPPTNTSQA